MGNTFINKLTRIKAIADTGLLYAADEYNKERYTELREIYFELMEAISGHSVETLKINFPLLPEYPTAKVDVRGMLLSDDGKILLVQESSDNCWSLPGGWADVGYSPKEVVIKEFKEETGLDIIPQQLLAVFDKKMHPHPPQPFYTYKIAFQCSAVSTQINKGFDVLDVAWFDINNLPPLSEERILKSQVELLYKKISAADFIPWVD
jgi:ADP-ribose pyrophosphatase YjhB (NUDIX family)